MVTEKLRMENRRFASSGSTWKRDKGNRVGRARRRQVAAVSRQRRREVVGGGRAAVACVRGQRPGGRLNGVRH
jgi:hypothetical protein